MLRRHLWSAWLLVLLSLAGIAFALGERQPLFQNRAKTTIPMLDAESLRDPATFSRLDDVVRDALPFRDRAVELTGRIALEVFGESPTREVAVGDDGWLYLTEELRNCQDRTRLRLDPADALELVVRSLHASGRRVTAILSESKFATRSRDAPEVDPAAQACTARLERRIARRVTQLPGGLEVGSVLRRLEAVGTATFLKNDTHWNWRGREIFLRSVLDGIRPGLADEIGLGPGRRYERAGDLGVVMGVPRSEPDRSVVARRAPSRPVRRRSVAFVGDSQLRADLIEPVAGTGTTIRDRALPGQLSCDVLALTDCEAEIRAADHVVLEVVARHLPEMVSMCWVPVAVAAERLRGRPARWQRWDGAWQPASGRTQILADGAAMLRVSPAGPERTTMPRLFRIRVLRLPRDEGGGRSEVVLAQRPRAGGEAPCATPTRSRAGSDLILPVPAGRSTSDLPVRITGPPGSELGPPEEIRLGALGGR